MAPAEIDVILFDFGGTLAEEVDSLFLDDVPPKWHENRRRLKRCSSKELLRPQSSARNVPAKPGALRVVLGR
jgi:hypothetical protein